MADLSGLAPVVGREGSAPARKALRVLIGLVAAVAVAAAVLGLAAALAVWPGFVFLTAVLGLVCGLAVFAPVWAFALALLLFGAEGSTKVLLSATGMPVRYSPNTVGAAFLDLALAVGLLGLLIHDRGRKLRSLWRQLTLPARAAAVLLAAWLVVSAAQIAQGGSLTVGIDGYRLSQAYVFAALGGALLIPSRRYLAPVIWVLLAGFALVATYAAVRAAVGPSALERSLSIARSGSAFVQTSHGKLFRNVGSISSPFGLASYLVPAAAFSAILALLVPRYRALGAIVFGAATAGIIGAQVRAGLVALLIGVVVGTVFALSLSDLALRAKLTGAVAIVVLLLIGAGATAVASSVSPQLRSRAKGILNPLGDSNMKARIKLWRRTIHQIRQHPLGTGVGTVGRASSLQNRALQTTDNSYVKIAREQGIIGAPFFLAALVLGTVAVLGGLYRAPPAARPLGVAALTGFVSFFILAIAGEYIEQPGKVLAWTFFGLAAYQAWGTREARGTETA